MADPFTIVTGVAGLLSFSIELAGAIRSYAVSVKGAPKAVEELIHKLDALGQVLKKLVDFLDAEESKGSSFSDTSDLRPATTHCTEKLQVLSTKLKKHTDGTKASRTFERLKWPFTEKEAQHTVKAVHEYIRILNLSVTTGSFALQLGTSEEVSRMVDQLGALASTLSTIETDVSQISKQVSSIASFFPNVWQKLSDIANSICALGRKLDDCEDIRIRKEASLEKGSILNWLSPLTFKERHQDVRALRQPGTGQWFLESDEFKMWSGEGMNPMLWCSGIPGAGKTVMTSAVVDHLATQEDTGIAYVYCDFKDKRQTTINLFSSLARQLAEQLPTLPVEVIEFYTTHLERRRPDSGCPTIEDYSQLLLLLSQSFPRTFLLVNGLDECHDIDGPGFDGWNMLLSHQQMTESRIKLLVTSRSHHRIQRIFENSPRIDILASRDDIESHITSKVASFTHLAEPIAGDPTLTGLITTKVNEMADGMFLVAHLQMERLGSQTSFRKIRTALKTPPESLNHTYDDTLSRIRSQSKDHTELALRVLAWVYHAKQPFIAEELLHALAVEAGDDYLDSSGLSKIEILIGVCGGLVTLDAKSGEIRLAHDTIREYLASVRHQLFPNAETDIARICLTYLSFAVFGEGPCSDSESLQRRLSDHPFLKYAANNWSSHLRGKPESVLLDSALEYLRNPRKTAATLQAVEGWVDPQGMGEDFTALHFAAGVGLEGAIHVLVEETDDVDVKDNRGETALYWAVKNGHPKVAKFLLGHGAEVAVWSKCTSYSPLDVAAEKGHDSLVRLLLELWPEDIIGFQALGLAAREGHESIVGQLLDRGLNFSVEEMSIALRNAVSRGHHDVMRSLLDSRVKINIDYLFHDSTALMAAAHEGDEEAVRLLLEHGADVNSWHGRYAIQIANERGHKVVAAMLIARRRPRLRRRSTLGYQRVQCTKNDATPATAFPAASSTTLPPTPPASISSKAPPFAITEDTTYTPLPVLSPGSSAAKTASWVAAHSRSSSGSQHSVFSMTAPLLHSPMYRPFMASRPTTPSTISRPTTPTSEAPLPPKIPKRLTDKRSWAPHPSTPSIAKPVTSSWVPKLKGLYSAPTTRCSVENASAYFYFPRRDTVSTQPD